MTTPEHQAPLSAEDLVDKISSPVRPQNTETKTAQPATNPFAESLKKPTTDSKMSELEARLRSNPPTTPAIGAAPAIVGKDAIDRLLSDSGTSNDIGPEMYVDTSNANKLVCIAAPAVEKPRKVPDINKPIGYYTQKCTWRLGSFPAMGFVPIRDALIVYKKVEASKPATTGTRRSGLYAWDYLTIGIPKPVYARVMQAMGEAGIPIDLSKPPRTDAKYVYVSCDTGAYPPEINVSAAGEQDDVPKWITVAPVPLIDKVADGMCLVADCVVAISGSVGSEKPISSKGAASWSIKFKFYRIDVYDRIEYDAPVGGVVVSQAAMRRASAGLLQSI